MDKKSSLASKGPTCRNSEHDEDAKETLEMVWAGPFCSRCRPFAVSIDSEDVMNKYELMVVLDRPWMRSRLRVPRSATALFRLVPL